MSSLLHARRNATRPMFRQERNPDDFSISVRHDAKAMSLLLNIAHSAQLTRESLSIMRPAMRRRVAEVDPSLAGDVERELARMQQKAVAADKRQKKQWTGAFNRSA